MPTEIELIDTRTISDPDPARAGLPATWVMYRQLPDGAPRSVYLHKPNPTDREIQEAIKADMDRNGNGQGRRLFV
jgi:hypothetical protein